VHSRVKSISALGLQRFGPTLKRLCLRQNHIKALDPEVMKALVNLAELDLYDNKIKDVGGTLDTLVDITYVVHPSAWSMLGQRPTWNL
jgi:protein phosphatase 1 regulatory subunit 7